MAFDGPLTAHRSRFQHCLAGSFSPLRRIANFPKPESSARFGQFVEKLFQGAQGFEPGPRQRVGPDGPSGGPDFLDLGPEAFYVSPFKLLELFVDVFRLSVMEGPSLSGKRPHYHFST